MTNRKNVKSEIHKNVKSQDIDLMADMAVEEREGAPKSDDPNRYEKILDSRKEEKRIREEKKLQKPHIGNRKHIEKRAVVEASDMYEAEEE